MAKSIISQLVGHSIGFPKKLTKPVNYILCGSGAKEVRETELGTFIVTPIEIAGLEKVPEGFTMRLPKIPITLLLTCLSFFKQVYLKHHSEALLQIFWDRKAKSYYIHCPPQEVGPAFVKFEHNTAMEKVNTLALELHSHGNMQAFFSSTDDGDEKATRLYAVAGQITEPLPQLKIRACCGKSSIPIALDEIFDLALDIPDKWFKALTPDDDEIQTELDMLLCGCGLDQDLSGLERDCAKQNNARKKEK